MMWHCYATDNNYYVRCYDRLSSYRCHTLMYKPRPIVTNTRVFCSRLSLSPSYLKTSTLPRDNVDSSANVHFIASIYFLVESDQQLASCHAHLHPVELWTLSQVLGRPLLPLKDLPHFYRETCRGRPFPSLVRRRRPLEQASFVSNRGVCE